jgi:hypothetical protein
VVKAGSNENPGGGPRECHPGKSVLGVCHRCRRAPSVLITNWSWRPSAPRATAGDPIRPASGGAQWQYHADEQLLETVCHWCHRASSSPTTMSSKRPSELGATAGDPNTLGPGVPCNIHVDHALLRTVGRWWYMGAFAGCAATPRYLPDRSRRQRLPVNPLCRVRPTLRERASCQFPSQPPFSGVVHGPAQLSLNPAARIACIGGVGGASNCRG